MCGLSQIRGHISYLILRYLVLRHCLLLVPHVGYIFYCGISWSNYIALVLNSLVDENDIRNVIHIDLLLA